MSISSSKVMQTDMGEKASSTSPSKVSIDLIFEVNPEGSIVTSSPGLKTPPSILPAYPL